MGLLGSRPSASRPAAFSPSTCLPGTPSGCGLASRARRTAPSSSALSARPLKREHRGAVHPVVGEVHECPVGLLEGLRVNAALYPQPTGQPPKLLSHPSLVTLTS